MRVLVTGAAGGIGAATELGLEPPYDELAEQWFGTDSKLLGDAGRPQPDVVGEAIWQAITTDEPRLRHPVGTDAEMILATRAQLDDEAFEAAMRSTLDLSW